ncbi:MAG: hydrolase, partial [Verrucomicrobiaceae bacterium]|nr:hydrolase [Verrucomicrobiaceae bacterium]
MLTVRDRRQTSVSVRLLIRLTGLSPTAAAIWVVEIEARQRAPKTLHDMNLELPPLLQDLLNTPSPTGFECHIQRLIGERFEGIAEHIEADVFGNLILSVNQDAPRKVMLAGHCDQIGFLVKYISPEGYIYVDPLGGTDNGVIPGSNIVIHTDRGPVEGVVGRKPVAFQKQADREQIPDQEHI